MSKPVTFKSLEELVPVKNVAEEAQMALQEKKRAIATSSMPEILRGVAEMDAGVTDSFAALYCQRSVELRPSGIASAWAVATNILSGPIAMGLIGYGMFTHMKSKDLIQAKEELLKLALRLHDGISQQLKKRLKNKDRLDYLNSLNILLEAAIRDITSDLANTTTQMDDIKEYTLNKINSAIEVMSKENLEKYGQIIKDTAAEAASSEKIERYRTILCKAAEDSWKYTKDTSEIAAEKYNKMDKGYKILAIAAMAGGAVVSIPFIVSAAAGVSIVSALATLGFGALAAGGYGVAGGIIVTGAGSALAAALAGAVASKVIDDPEVNELIENYSKLEEIIKQNFVTMDNHQAKYKHLYKKYAATAIYVAELKDQILNGQKYDINEVRDTNNRIKYTIEDIQKELESEAV